MQNAESESIHKLVSFSVSDFYINRDSDDLYIFSQLNSAAMRNRYHDFWWVSFAHPRCHCCNCEKRLMSQRKVVNYCNITSFNAVPIIVASLFIFDACINAYLIIHFTAIPVACCECYVEKKNHKKTSYSRENFYLLHPASLPPFFCVKLFLLP